MVGESLSKLFGLNHIEEQGEQVKEIYIDLIRANPYQFYLKYAPCKLRWYQKIWLWIMCKFSKSLEGL